jgi:hypothetical protein
MVHLKSMAHAKPRRNSEAPRVRPRTHINVSASCFAIRKFGHNNGTMALPCAEKTADDVTLTTAGPFPARFSQGGCEPDGIAAGGDWDRIDARALPPRPSTLNVTLQC